MFTIFFFTEKKSSNNEKGFTSKENMNYQSYIHCLKLGYILSFFGTGQNVFFSPSLALYLFCFFYRFTFLPSFVCLIVHSLTQSFFCVSASHALAYILSFPPKFQSLLPSFLPSSIAFLLFLFSSFLPSIPLFLSQ